MKDNVVGTVTRVRARRTVVRIAADANEFSPKCRDQLLGPPSLLFSMYWGLSPGVNTLWTGDADLRLYITTVQDG